MTAPALPADAPPKLREAYSSLSSARRRAFYDHLIGGTSADYLAGWLKRAGSPVGATTIKSFRRKGATA